MARRCERRRSAAGLETRLRRLSAALPLAALALIAPAPASAQAIGGVLEGLLHPILGFEHLTAMVLVGLLSAQLGGSALWTAPTLFLFAMTAGAALALAGVAPPRVDGVIALSVVCLGLLVAIGARRPRLPSFAAIAFFGVFHGHAHSVGLELLPDPAAFVGGFMLATGLLHLIGLGIGEACLLFRDPRLSRGLIGAGGAGIGLHMALLSFSVI